MEARVPDVAARSSRPSSPISATRTKFVWREWPVHDGYVVNEEGLVACKIYKTLPARRMWDVIMSSTYDFAEPGFILIDRVNEMNNNWWCENIRATNPCVTADTRLATQFGMVRIGDLYDARRRLFRRRWIGARWARGHGRCGASGGAGIHDARSPPTYIGS